jgi:hypothetical protein
MRNKSQYQVQFPPTVKKVIELFDYNREDYNLVDESNCINLTALEDFLIDEYYVVYGSDEHKAIEDVCVKAQAKLLKRGDFNE